MMRRAAYEAKRGNEKASFRLFRYEVYPAEVRFVKAELETYRGTVKARVRVSRRGLSCLTSPFVADDGRTRVFVAFRDAERFVSDGAGTARRAKRRGRGAMTGETATEIQRTVS